MFTGIVEAVGKVREPVGNGAGVRVTVTCPEGFLDGVAVGDSIAVNGACMTVVELAGNDFAVDVSLESLSKTTGFETFGAANLEKALAVGDRLGGHFVTGHVDAVGEVLRFEKCEECVTLEILLPKVVSHLAAPKGSVTVNGVSLTVNTVEDCPSGARITINLIPHTLEATTLGRLKAGSLVNIEADVLARYMARILASQGDNDGLF